MPKNNTGHTTIIILLLSLVTSEVGGGGGGENNGRQFSLLPRGRGFWLFSKFFLVD